MTTRSVVGGTFKPSKVPSNLFLTSGRASVVRVARIGTSLSRTNSRGTYLVINGQITGHILHYGSSRVGSVRLRHGSVSTHGGQSIRFVLDFHIRLADPRLRRRTISNITRHSHSHMHTVRSSRPSFPSPISSTPRRHPIIINTKYTNLFTTLALTRTNLGPLLVRHNSPTFHHSRTVSLFLGRHVLSPRDGVRFNLNNTKAFSSNGLGAKAGGPTRHLVLRAFIRTNTPHSVL